MAKHLTFQFGPADNLDQRNLKVYKVNANGSRTELHNTNHAGSTTDVEVEVDNDLMCEAVLTDTRKGVAGVPAVLKFNTSHPPQQNWESGDAGDRGRLWISSWEDMSSSSSTSSQSSSSSSSTSSQSSSSSSSPSSSNSSSNSSSSSSST